MKKNFIVEKEFDHMLGEYRYVVYSYERFKMFRNKEVSCTHYDKALKWKFDFEESEQ